ncbi:hypothetical protein [Teichococcus vastitatis]|jgi:hypothetical protein|uniref:Heme exporter protein D n=1 Tax=Teichococcus vastitatis TaxID=2307076 RepID=A0ABS9WC38_9PROT|nr:hypothetical protein [Pseudoroseomonas vastitatis]MCI0756873.1 hypothetical protein [Pseudoroseomonas vastitatis]
MTQHWWHVAIAWGLAALGFGIMAWLAARRHAAAKRRLALLGPRERRLG